MNLLRLPIVAVIGSGTIPHLARAEPLGRMLAALPVHLLTGGGGGVMAAVSKAFAETPGRRGLVIGVLPADKNDRARPRSGYPNPWVEIPIVTHLPLSGARGEEDLARNHINILSAQAIVALPGEAGTLSEVRLALRYQRPIIAFLRDGNEIAGLLEGAPMVSELYAVEEFVRRQLGERGA